MLNNAPVSTPHSELSRSYFTAYKYLAASPMHPTDQFFWSNILLLSMTGISLSKAKVWLQTHNSHCIANLHSTVEKVQIISLIFFGLNSSFRHRSFSSMISCPPPCGRSTPRPPNAGSDGDRWPLRLPPPVAGGRAVTKPPFSKCFSNPYQLPCLNANGFTPPTH